jgi:8-oxo-dGTP pyrophosphatase MutT (NUDIX family)
MPPGFTSKVSKFYKLVAAETVAAAGGIFYAEDTKRILVARRSGLVEDPYTWSTWGGKLDKEETPEMTVKREIIEETGYTGAYKLQHVHTYKDSKVTYDTFYLIVPKEFKPKLNWENLDYRWTRLEEIPEPLHPGLRASLPQLKAKLPKVTEINSKLDKKPASGYSSFMQKVKKQVQLKDEFYHPFDKGLIEPRNGGFQFPLKEELKEKEDELSEESKDKDKS